MRAIYWLVAEVWSWPAFLQLKGIAGQYSYRCLSVETDAN
jgi:hypothetical protein